MQRSDNAEAARGKMFHPRRLIGHGQKKSQIDVIRRSSVIPAFDEPSPKNDADNIRSPLQAFNVLFSSDLMEKVVTHTNEQITRELTRLRQDNRIIQSVTCGFSRVTRNLNYTDSRRIQVAESIIR